LSQKIAFIGPPGSGKSTLAADVYTTLKQQGVNTEAIHEWVRHDIHRHGPMKSIWEQYRTRQHQMELEDAVPASVDYVIVDSGTLTPYFYAALYADMSDSRQRLVLHDMYRFLLDDLFLRRYDLIFYLPSQSGTNIDDGTRFQTAEELRTLEAHMDLVFCNLFKTDRLYRIDGPFDTRLARVMHIIKSCK